MPKKWVQSMQLAFFNSKIPDFVKAQLDGKVKTHFEPLLWAEWTAGGYDLVPVPSEDAPEAEKEIYRQHVDQCKRQLIGWFYNNATKRKQQGLVSDNTVQNIVSASSSHSKGTRSRTDIQNFSSTHYNELVKPKVDAELDRMCTESGGKLAKGAHLPVVTRVTRDVWELLSDDVKREVKRKREEEDFDQKRGADGRKIIKEFPRYLNTICNKIRSETNFTVSVMVGGWDETEQQIVIHSFHAGENELGLPFNVAHPEYKAQWSDAFGKFASSYIKGERIRNPNADPPVGPRKLPSPQLLVPGPSHSASSEPPVQATTGLSHSPVSSRSISPLGGPALPLEGAGMTSQTVPPNIPFSQSSSSAPSSLNYPATLSSQTVSADTILHPAHFSPTLGLEPTIPSSQAQSLPQAALLSQMVSADTVLRPAHFSSALGRGGRGGHGGRGGRGGHGGRGGGQKRKAPSGAGKGGTDNNPVPKKKGRKEAEPTENDKGENMRRSGRERQPPARYVT
ncbi:hypothetical protein VKT23_013042 [Stygiomarasmius scandens]|uniref:Uncharacterized protein n=1 Tax=Marasmiellus scandens TaxID=2682957 RepID=A0ABR1J4D0_9AGAR